MPKKVQQQREQKFTPLLEPQFTPYTKLCVCVHMFVCTLVMLTFCPVYFLCIVFVTHSSESRDKLQ